MRAGEELVRLASLGVHEHWNNAVEKLYSRDQGLDEGIELFRLNVNREAPSLAVRRSGPDLIVSWPNSHFGYRLESAEELGPSTEWESVGEAPVVERAQNIVSNMVGESRRFYRLSK